MRLWAHCLAPNAGHGGPLDLDRLIDRYGADYVVVGEKRIGARAVCSKCRHRGAMITVSPPHVTNEVGARRENGGAN